MENTRYTIGDVLSVLAEDVREAVKKNTDCRAKDEHVDDTKLLAMMRSALGAKGSGDRDMASIFLVLKNIYKTL